MDPAIRPVEDTPIAPTPAVRRRREGDAEAFDLERELARGEGSETPDAQPEEPPPTHEDAPVAPPDEDEAGGRVDLTA